MPIPDRRGMTALLPGDRRRFRICRNRKAGLQDRGGQSSWFITGCSGEPAAGRDSRGWKGRVLRTLQQTGMGDKEPVMAQADIHPQRPTLKGDPGRPRLTSALLPGDRQLARIGRKQPGQVKSGSQANRLGFSGSPRKKTRKKIMNTPGKSEPFWRVGKGQAMKVGGAIDNPEPARPPGRQDKTRTFTGIARLPGFAIGRVCIAFRIERNREEPGNCRDIREGLADRFVRRFFCRPAGPECPLGRRGKPNGALFIGREDACQEAGIPALPSGIGLRQIHNVVADLRQNELPPSGRVSQCTGRHSGDAPGGRLIP